MNPKSENHVSKSQPSPSATGTPPANSHESNQTAAAGTEPKTNVPQSQAPAAKPNADSASIVPSAPLVKAEASRSKYLADNHPTSDDSSSSSGYIDSSGRGHSGNKNSNEITQQVNNAVQQTLADFRNNFNNDLQLNSLFKEASARFASNPHNAYTKACATAVESVCTLSADLNSKGFAQQASAIRNLADAINLASGMDSAAGQVKGATEKVNQAIQNAFAGLQQASVATKERFVKAYRDFQAQPTKDNIRNVAIAGADIMLSESPANPLLRMHAARSVAGVIGTEVDAIGAQAFVKGERSCSKAPITCSLQAIAENTTVTLLRGGPATGAQALGVRTAAQGAPGFSTLKSNGEQLLMNCKIDSESFGTSLNDPGHQLILTQTGEIVNRVGELNEFLNDPKIYDLASLTADTCTLANELSQQGLSSEAQVVVNFASALSEQVQDVLDRPSDFDKTAWELGAEAIRNSAEAQKVDAALESLWTNAQRIGDGEVFEMMKEKALEIANNSAEENALNAADLLITFLGNGGKKVIPERAKNIVRKAFKTLKIKSADIIKSIKGKAQQPHTQPMPTAAGAGQVPSAPTASAMQSNNTTGGGGAGSSNSGQSTTKPEGNGGNKASQSGAAASQGAVKPYGTYEDAGYHHLQSKGGVKSKGPTNGQRMLDSSVEVSNNGPAHMQGKTRIAIQAEGEYVVLYRTREGYFHGHVRTWKELTSEMKEALTKPGITDANGKIKKL